MMIGGNTKAIIQIKVAQKNEIGEQVELWTNHSEVLGWLDYLSGQAENMNFKGKLQDTTHIFMCDHFRWVEATQDSNPTPELIRMVINNEIFNVLLIDNPMGLNQHEEILLEYVGGGLNG